MNTFYKSFSFTWALSLFGTAVGAGVLFLPINAGMGGFWPLIIMTILVGPRTYFAHRGLARFVLSSKNPGQDITYVVQEHFGKTGGRLITLLYFLAIYPILLIYGVGITNTVLSFMQHQLHIAVPKMGEGGYYTCRAVAALILIGVMVAIMLTSEKLILRVTNWLVYPLIVILFGLSLYLIPHWNTAVLRETPSVGTLVTTLWLTIPVLVFSFNHSPAISSCAVSHAHQFPDAETADREISKTLRQTAVMLVGFVMLFVFSCVLSLTPQDLAQAKAENIPILSYLANHFDNPVISYFGPFIAFLAISSSFFGHYFGAREGFEGLINQFRDKPIAPKTFRKFTAVFFMITLWIVAILNPSVLGLIESLSGPVIAMILFLMPMYAIHHVPALQRFRGTPGNIFVVVMGSIAISAVIYKLF